jgi:hypothetical protein
MAVMLVLALSGASALLSGLRPAAVPVRVAMSSTSSWEEYMKERAKGKLAGGTIDESNAGMQEFLKGGGDSEFDGGDSGGGVVGDGNTDLSDQHNSASIARGGFDQANVGQGRTNVGRGRVAGATNARQASAGKNYFGRSTGLADEMISKISEDDRKTGRMDEVRAQQFENWFNQRAIHKSNKEQGQGVVFGAQKNLERSNFNAQEAIASNVWRQGTQDNEISQKDLASHLQQLASLPAQRLDGGRPARALPPVCEPDRPPNIPRAWGPCAFCALSPRHASTARAIRRPSVAQLTLPPLPGCSCLSFRLPPPPPPAQLYPHTPVRA